MAALQHGARKFYEVPSRYTSKRNTEKQLSKNQSAKELFRYIEEHCIGKETTFNGPYGTRKVIYCDYTASGRSLTFIEDYIREQVLPHYGNTHTTTTVTSLQTTLYRHESRDIIRNAVNAGEGDAVIFTGSGCTAAVHKLIHALNLTQPPVVFMGPFSHHSSILPWKEAGGDIVWIKQTVEGLVDQQDLLQKLQIYMSSGKPLVGCFAAASNVTGILSDTNAITAILHRHGALACWDYATAGPYVEINMNPVVTSEDQLLVYKDAIFLSMHKFVGGVGTPGVLIAKKKLFQNPVPSGCGGGSVFYVTENSHRYLQETEIREEGGTPAIVESIRAGLVLQLKEALGHENIMEQEERLCSLALTSWSNVHNLILLGNKTTHRLPIFSFLIKHPDSGLFLHYNYVSAVLNDLFGVQSRGGCACAGPYAQDLLGMDEELAKQFESLLLEDCRLDRVHLRRYHEYSEHEILRPGFVRLNLPYFMSDDYVHFVLDAVAMVAQHGWKLLPQYMFNPETGEWKHRRHKVFRDRKWLGSISYTNGHMTYPAPVQSEGLPKDLNDCLFRAKDIFENAGKAVSSLSDHTLLLGEEAEKLRWFLLQSEAASVLVNKPALHTSKQPPFTPRTWGHLINGVITEETHNKRNPQLNARDIDSDYLSIESSSTNIEMCRPRGLDSNDSTKCTLKCDENVYDAEWNVSGLSFSVNANTKNISPLRAQNNDNVNSGLTSNDTGADQVESFVMKSSSSSSVVEEGVSSSSSSSAAKALSSSSETAATLTLSQSSSSTPTTTPSPLSSLSSSPSTTTSSQLLLSSSSSTTSQSSSLSSSTTSSQLSSLSSSSSKTASQSPSLSSSSSTTPASPSSRTNASTRVDCRELGQACPLMKQNNAVTKTKQDKYDSKLEKTIKETKTSKPKFFHPPKSIFKPMVEAIDEFSMIEDGDRVMVCLSGGKDSLSMLHALHQYKYLAKSKGIVFDIGAATVDPQSTAYDPRPLIPYLASLGVPYFFEEQGIIQQAAGLSVCESICSFCSRMKRGRLYACARREGYNVLAMGQHLDDLAESFLMSTFHNGLLRTMKANYTVQEGDLRVIRPLVFVREKELRQFAEKAKLPVIAENCPACFEAPKERHRTKQLLAAQELLFPEIYSSLLTAMKPLMAKNRVGMESSKMKSADYDEFL